jgi:two-component system sensor histidine kinase YesM
MRQAASGYLDAKVKPSGQDEIADLGTSFNTMIEKIKMLLEQSIREQEHIQKAELRTLQAQINPHFLYNTLDSIVWMAEAGKNEQVIQLVQALSRFFRISLNKGRDWISIKIELDHVQSYLIIQKMRYRDILDYEVNVGPELQVYPILKMTLQPLVENALYHGIKNKRGKGLIRIGAYIDQVQDIVLFVEDNGIGMNSERLDAVRAQLDQPRDLLPEEADIEDGKNGGFGLQNVHQRLRLYFGERYGLQIDSEEHKGTCVYVRIPKK